jgi:hypothetical protein
MSSLYQYTLYAYIYSLYEYKFPLYPPTHSLTYMQPYIYDLTLSGLRQLTQRFIWSLYMQLRSLLTSVGHSSISRATVKEIVLQYHRSHLNPRCMLQRQRIMQEFVCSMSFGLDFTNMVASLTAADDAAHTSSHRRKCASFGASIATATVEHSFVLAAVISPGDSHVVPAAILCGLHHAELPNDLADDAHRVRQDVALPGRLHDIPVCIATDHVIKDKNLWKRMCRSSLVPKLILQFPIR